MDDFDLILQRNTSFQLSFWTFVLFGERVFSALNKKIIPLYKQIIAGPKTVAIIGLVKDAIL